MPIDESINESVLAVFRETPNDCMAREEIMSRVRTRRGAMVPIDDALATLIDDGKLIHLDRGERYILSPPPLAFAHAAFAALSDFYVSIRHDDAADICSAADTRLRPALDWIAQWIAASETRITNGT